jgi:hypothetical protein
MHLKNGKVYPITGPEGEGVGVYPYSFVNSALKGSGWSVPRPGRFTLGKDPVLIVQEAGWARGPVWTGAENLAPTGMVNAPRKLNIVIFTFTLRYSVFRCVMLLLISI